MTSTPGAHGIFDQKTLLAEDSVVHGVKTTRLCQKINAKYYVLLQLQLERLGFDPVDLEPDP